ncbi:LssY C-terminal domain-containing protein [Tautonia rosea]|uniref:LssY C-terminal domain-containing protein n=1 Tax=Tautonia rosea TaxID=2728037 RepID=UPI0014736D4E|nr:LssY C-terminal domain-containing protein [Tautonia rosea]
MSDDLPGKVTPPLPEPKRHTAPLSPPRRPRWQRILIRAMGLAIAVILTWLILAYLILPVLWRHYEHHPIMERAPKITRTAQGIPGDPLNVGLIGSKEELIQSMLNSGWDAADPITLRSSLAIARSVLRNRPDADAPVSNLYLFGRKQDLAFEKPVGTSARHRHHVRFWESSDYGRDGIPLWIGAVTYDRSVGFSRRTGQITHHIGPDIDAERNGLIADLQSHGWLTEEFQVTGVGPTLSGRNGGGDRYFTDGELTIGVLASSSVPDRSPSALKNPVAIRIKDQLWSAIRPLLQSLPDPQDQDSR